MASEKAKLSQKEEKTTREKLAEIVNKIITQAVETRKGFTPELISEFEATGEKARENRELRGTKPSKYLGSLIVTKKEEKAESVMTTQVTRSAIETAMDLYRILDEQIERLDQGKKLRREEW